MAPTISLKQAIDRTVKLGSFYSFEVFMFKSKRLDFAIDLMLLNFKSMKLTRGWVIEIRGFDPLSNSNHHLSTFVPEGARNTDKPVNWSISNLQQKF